MFHRYSPGSAFFLPHGTRIYNALLQFLREQYRVRGFDEVITPNIFHSELWKQSGHYAHYKDDMFAVSPGAVAPRDCCEHEHEHEHQHKSLEPEPEQMLKPMNCPAHCLIFARAAHSYRELPIRYADFGVLHRNELAGALSGLTRVRRFQQDDAHIFCRHDQIGSEVRGCLDFVQHVYGVLGFDDLRLRLATRPASSMGSDEQWAAAEAALQQCLRDSKLVWSVADGDGAFYGPKIDMTVSDAAGRQHQCATIQLDFQLPQRFQLSYKGADNADHTPVMIHRAILGSVERMMAMLIEHWGGDWPLWLSPRQLVVLPTAARSAYTDALLDRLRRAGFHADLSDDADGTLKKRIVASTQARYNYMLVVGPKEQDTNTVTVRERSHSTQRQLTLDELMLELQSRVADKR